jgi:hypothetical protein
MDSAGCQQQATATLEAPDALQLSVSATNLTCHEGPEGSIQLSAQGGSQPYSYSVDSGMTFQASASFDSLAAGSYDILLEDNNKCQASDSVTLTQPDSIQYSLNTVAPNCFGGTGSIVLSGVSGGNGGFSYALDTGSFQQQSSFQGVAAGPHTVRIQDDSGCVQAVPVPLNAPDSLTLSITTTDSDTGTSNGTARVDASGGTAPYSYQWNTTPPQTMDSISGLSPGTYRVIVTDNNGCQDTAWATIELISSRADSHPQPGLALSIYPNPSKGEVHLEGLEPGHAAYQLHVYDAQGRLVRRQTLTPSKSQATLHLQALPAGLYNLRLHQGARSFSAQLLLR